jgi:hypothetical protein
MNISLFESQTTGSGTDEDLERNGENENSSLVLKDKVEKGLSELVRLCFGKPLNK